MVGSDFMKYYAEMCNTHHDPKIFEVAGTNDYIKIDEAFLLALPENRYIGNTNIVF